MLYASASWNSGTQFHDKGNICGQLGLSDLSSGERSGVIGKEMKPVQLSPLTWVHFSSFIFPKCQLLLLELSPKILSENFQK